MPGLLFSVFYVCNISDSWYPFQVRVGFLHSSSDGCKNTKCLAQHKGAAHKVQLRHFLACVSHANLFICNGWLPFSQKIQKLWFEINSNFVENLFTNFRLEKLLFFFFGTEWQKFLYNLNNSSVSRSLLGLFMWL